MTQELKYLEKISNDVSERLYDLLIMHLIDVDKKISPQGENKERLIEILDKALKNLLKNIGKYNRLAYSRYIIIICNKILRYNTSRSDLKDIKKRIIEEFIQAEEDEGELIPLNYQINEIRITYDADYLTYCINRFSKLKMWDKALYCYIAVRMVEPDKEGLDELYESIKKNIIKKPIENKSFGFASGKSLLLDSNIVILHTESKINIEAGTNKIMISPSVINEVKKHIEFSLVKAKKRFREDRTKYEELKNKLESRFNDLIKKYSIEVKFDEDLVEDIKKFYSDYLCELEEILISKLEGKNISSKLRKLAQREGLLPEEGDIRLLAEAITLKAGIMSNDSDFIRFISPIFDRFGVEVYKLP